MSLVNWLRKAWLKGFGKSGRRASARTPRRESCLLRLEPLEERVARAVLFSLPSPVFFTDNGFPGITNPDIELIFWGSQFNQGFGASTDDIQNAVDTLLASPYLDGLRQYRPVGGGSSPTRTRPTAVSTTTFPSSSTTTSPTARSPTPPATPT
jgi:hypothetical protein